MNTTGDSHSLSSLPLSYRSIRIIFSPGEVPETLTPQHRAILASLDQIAADADRVQEQSTNDIAARVEFFAEYSGLDIESTIAIFGERGSGKSTLLQHICGSLLQNGIDLVIPAIRPERFSKGDTLIGWVLSGIHRLLGETGATEALNRTLEMGGKNRTLSDLLERLRRQAAFFGAEYSDEFAPGRMAPEEFAQDIARLPTIGLDFEKNWNRFVAELLAAAATPISGQRSPLLIVPIDDADLTPALLPQILTDIRRLATSPRLAVILCASLSTVQESLTRQRLQELGSMETSWLQSMGIGGRAALMEQVDRQLTKSFPRQHRVEIPSCSLLERLTFRPVGDEHALNQVLSTFRVDGSLPFMETLNELFSLGLRIGSDGVAPSPYTETLSPNRRDLSQLHALLSSLSKSGLSGNEKLSEATRIIVLQAVNSCMPQLPPALHNSISLRKLDGRVHAELDLRDVSFGQVAGTGVVILRQDSPKRTFGIRRISDVSTAAYQSGDHRVPLPSSYTYTLALVDELQTENATAQPIFVLDGMYGDFPPSGGMNSPKTITVRVDGRTADDTYWLMPRWDAHTDLFYYQVAWNQLVDLAQSALQALSGVKEKSALQEFLWLSHLEVITRIQDSRNVSNLLSHLSADNLVSTLSPRVWDQEIASRIQHVHELIRDVYASQHSAAETSVRASDFIDWVRIYFPFSCDTSSITPRLAEWGLKLRSDLLGDDLNQANADCCSQIAQRLADHLQEPWAVSRIELLAKLDPNGSFWSAVSEARDAPRKSEHHLPRRAGIAQVRENPESS
ncbi:hypothetical protein [Streptomyces mirabilis]|uniref:hypothetical protein n=1 Tax=Streptomyces mirabilis TaxID=68239 RepID=UPI00369FA4B7